MKFISRSNSKTRNVPPFPLFLYFLNKKSTHKHVCVYVCSTHTVYHSHFILSFYFDKLGLESSSNTLTSHPLREPLNAVTNGLKQHTLDDIKNEHPFRHHYSINRATNNDDDGADQHHNLVVSYENSIVNEYSEYC